MKHKYTPRKSIILYYLPALNYTRLTTQPQDKLYKD